MVDGKITIIKATILKGKPNLDIKENFMS